MDKRSIFFVVLLAASFYFINQWFADRGAPAPQRSVEQPQPTQERAELLAPQEFAVQQAPQGKEQFYLLENPYQQLLFSTVGGALVEINLPLASRENPASVIRPIRFDTIMQERYSENDHFPATVHFALSENGAPSLQPEGPIGGYYPLLRRSIVGKEGRILHKVKPEFYALNIVSDDPQVARLTYEVQNYTKNQITFVAAEANRRITKTYTLPKDPQEAPYTFDLTVKVEGDARGLALSTGVPEVELISGSASPLLKYCAFRHQKAQVESVKLPKTTTTFSSLDLDWVSNSNGFMGLILDPLKETSSGLSASTIPGEELPTRLSLIDAEFNLYPASKYPAYAMQIPLNRQAQTTTVRFFAGPYDNAILNQLDTTFTEQGVSPHYIAVQSFDRWFGFISEPFSKFLFFLMNAFYKITHSWGFSIILLTIALRIMMYPLNAWSFKSMAKMQKISPKVAALQEKYKKDPKRAQMEVMNLYRENRVNPITGCLPMLLQLPFLVGMFDLLKSTFDLRGAPFIPGWIDNLTSPDILFSWNYPVFFIGTSFHLLPILLGVIMFFQQKITQGLTGKKGVAVVTDQQKQQKMMGNVMVIVFTVLFYHFPSGLNIYWLSSMLLGILQQWYTNKAVIKQ